MKKILYILLLFLCSNVNGQENDKATDATMKEALHYLNGYLKPLNPSKAFALFMQCAEKGNAKAMNAVAVQYRAGLGTNTDHFAAFKWFKKAADKGYARAWYNLGLMYKYGNGCTLDYEKAYTCFSKASASHEPLGRYAEGYMLYKGLGCTQNYKKAFLLFQKGATAGNSSCMHFLGLSFRNGYGTDVNADSAYYWLEKARRLDYQLSNDELTLKEPENLSAVGKVNNKLLEAQGKVGRNRSSFGKFKKLTQNSYLDNIEGMYEGYLIKYDWSGQHVLKVTKLSLGIVRSESSLKVNWIEEDTVHVLLDGVLTKKGFVFRKNNGYQSESHRNTSTRSEILSFESAVFQTLRVEDSVLLTGNVYLFSPTVKEPTRPLYFSLIKISPHTERNFDIRESAKVGSNVQTQSSLKASPNPFKHTVNLSFNLKKDAKVQIQVVKINGQVVFTGTEMKLSSGEHTISLSPNIVTGTYLIKLYSDSEVRSTLVIKQ